MGFVLVAEQCPYLQTSHTKCLCDPAVIACHTRSCLRCHIHNNECGYFVSQLEWTPLMSAIVYGRYEVVAELICLGANVDLQDYVSSCSILLASWSKPT